MRVLGGRGHWDFPVLLFCLWKEVLDQGTPPGSSSGALALRAAVKLGPGVRYTWEMTTAPGSWGTGALAAMVVLVS